MGITRPNAQWATLCLFRGAHILYLYNASQQHTAFHNETFCRIIVSMRFWCKHLHKFEFAIFPFVIQQIHSKIRKDVNLFKVNNYMLLYVSVFPDVCCNGMPFFAKERNFYDDFAHAVMFWDDPFHCYKILYSTVINMGIRAFNYCSATLQMVTGHYGVFAGFPCCWKTL